MLILLYTYIYQYAYLVSTTSILDSVERSLFIPQKWHRKMIVVCCHLQKYFLSKKNCTRDYTSNCCRVHTWPLRPDSQSPATPAQPLAGRVTPCLAPHGSSEGVGLFRERDLYHVKVEDVWTPFLPKF